MITIFGHKVPDTDAITSALVYSHFLHQKGIEAQAATLGEINNETRFILNAAGIEAPKLIDELPE